MLALLALQPHSKKVMGSIPTWGAVGSGGLILPRPSVLRWAISQAFLCGVTWLKKAAHCSWGPGGRTVRDGINAEDKFTNDLRPVCVCPVSPPCIHVCCSESLVRLKSDNYIIIIQEGEVH